MEKPLMAFVICAMMLSTATIYFIAAFFGERLEGVIHEAKAVKEPGHQNLEGTPEHEAAENGHLAADNKIKQTSSNKESTGLTENNIGAVELGNESVKRSLEFPLFVTAGFAYTIVGLWIVMEKSITNIPYFITMFGSLLLIGLYILSHTIGFPLIGLEQIGPLDLTVAVLQAGIVTCCGYTLISLPKVIACRKGVV